ncbi:MAG: ribulose-phosphate 3-epimerase [Bacteroidetes bacterium]|nr:ribulose-phosphate 3-epimerase [Bacteroidota bacterium]
MTQIRHQILPSLLSADFGKLEENIKRLEALGVTTLHLDIMDGNFVPNISFGPDIVSTIRKITKLTLDTHLMIQHPEAYIEKFYEAGSDILTVHAEATVHLHRTVTRIQELGIKAGVAINPATPLVMLEEILPFVDLVLIMSVNPGFGGQKYIATSTKKISVLKELIAKLNVQPIIEVDGGINAETIQTALAAGAEYFVAGHAVFANNNIELNYHTLKTLLQ